MEIIRLSKSSISTTEKDAVHNVLDQEFLGMGKETQNFEVALSEFFGRSVLCVNTGTAALQLSLQACGIGRDDEVLVQSLTYVASFQAISATGAVPVACEVNPDTITIDVEDAARRITKKTKAIMPVYYGGACGNLNEVYNFAKRNSLRVIEDAAHAFGSTYKNKRIGSFGDITCFSFDGIKNITSGEGGCIVTSDKTVIETIKDLRLLGVEKDTEKRYSGQRSWEFDVTQQGWRYHMSNIMAAIGIEQLKRFPEIAKKRQSLAKLYDEFLQGIPEIKLFARDYDKIVPHIYPIKIQKNRNRDILREYLSKNGIETGVHYKPNHLLTYYNNYSIPPLNTTEKVFGELLTLPLHFDLSRSDVEKVCFHIKKGLSRTDVR